MLKDILNNFNNATATRATSAASEVEKTTQVARIARVQVAPPKKEDIHISDDIVSNWWLIHFVDRDPLQVAIWPPCNHTEALAMNPTAIAAEPIKSPVDEISSKKVSAEVSAKTALIQQSVTKGNN